MFICTNQSINRTEYAMKAALSGGNTAVGVRGAKSAAFITQKKVPVSIHDHYLQLISRY